MNGIRVLVTGAGGMIGGAVVAQLDAAGAQLRAHLGPPGAISGPIRAGIELRRCDVLDLGPLVDGQDVVVHLAGPPGVAASFAEPERYVRDHVLGTQAVLTALGTARLVYVSSAEVYGRPDRNPVTETATTQPLSPYAAAKLGAEALVRALRPDATILRPFSVYGPRSPAHSLVGSLIRQVPAAARIELASLAPVRDYLYVGDLARLVAICVTDPTPGTFNAATGQGISVGALAGVALAAAGRDVPIVATWPDRPADILELVGDPQRALDAFGWSAQVDLPTGLARCLAAR